MRTLTQATCAVAAAALMSSCAVMVGDHPGDGSPTSPATPSSPHSGPAKITLTATSLFPFEDNTNWWRYSESGGNQLLIAVADTISDNGVTYYRVLFQEERVDTTDDWFKSGPSGIFFSGSLTGVYSVFLPAHIDSVKGSFTASSGVVNYAYGDSLVAGGAVYREVVALSYRTPVIHGFSRIVLADSLGIVQLDDSSGRWPVEYDLDSCSIGGAVRWF